MIQTFAINARDLQSARRGAQILDRSRKTVHIVRVASNWAALRFKQSGATSRAGWERDKY
jgi:hypothetical protein